MTKSTKIFEITQQTQRLKIYLATYKTDKAMRRAVMKRRAEKFKN